MSILPHRWLLSSTIALFFLIPFTSLSQVTIKEKVEIKPQQESRPVKLAGASVLRVIASFDGMVNDTFPALVYINGPCNIRAGVPGASGALTVPAYEGIYEAGYHFTSVSGGRFNFTVLFGDSVLVDVHEPLDAHVTALSQHYLEMYTGIAFSVQYAAIWTKTENFFGASIVTGTEPCSEAHWSPLMTVEVEITRGSDIGELIDVGGIPVGSKITKRLSDLSNLTFVADGPKGYGDVEITARSGDIVIAQTFPVKVHPPTVRIDPPWWAGSPIKVSIADSSVLDATESHTPGPGQDYEPTISWEPANPINTADYLNRFDDTLRLYMKARAENPGGVAEDSVEMVLVKECIKVSFDRSPLSPGDTTGLSFQRVLPDGSLENLASGEYSFCATIVGGKDSSRGLLLGEFGAATSLFDESSIQYIAPKTFQGDKLEVQVTGAATRSGGGATSIGVPGKPSRMSEQMSAMFTKRSLSKSTFLNSVAVKNKPGRAQFTEAMIRAAVLSSWCPINQVVVKKPTLKILDHSPWMIWPSLPWLRNKSGKWFSTGSDRPGYNPKRGFSIQVLDNSGKPLKDELVNITRDFVALSGGHSHNAPLLDREAQGIFYGQGMNGDAVVGLKTDADGKIMVDSLVASEIAGTYVVTACLAADNTVRDTVDLTVGVPGLAPLSTGSNHLITCTSTLAAKNHVLAKSNYGDVQTRTAVTLAIEGYALDQGLADDVFLGACDMSLPLGGLFDINGYWNGPHALHRVGRSVDFTHFYRDASGNPIPVALYIDGQFVRTIFAVDEEVLDRMFSQLGLKREEIDNIHYEQKK